MSLFQLHSVACDDAGCDACSPAEVTRAEAIASARKDGWLTGARSRRDFCPLHRPDLLIGNAAVTTPEDPWQPLRDAGYTELELRAAAGDR